MVWKGSAESKKKPCCSASDITMEAVKFTHSGAFHTEFQARKNMKIRLSCEIDCDFEIDVKKDSKR